MGAALHLAPVQDRQDPKRKRRGGGNGGDGYDRFVARVWQDNRLTPETRELLLLVAWLRYRDPKLGETGHTFWGRATEILDAEDGGQCAAALGKDEDEAAAE